MAIIKVTQKLDNLDGMGLLAASLIGGKDEMKKMVDSVPDENTLWVNTDHVVAASAPITAEETGEVVFRIYFDHPDRKDNPIWIKGEDYADFIMAWNGSKKILNVGEYEVPSGYRAISWGEEGSKVTVEKIVTKEY